MTYGSWEQWYRRAAQHGAADFQVKCRSCFGRDGCLSGECGLLVSEWVNRHAGGQEPTTPTLDEQAEHIRTGHV